MSGFIAGPVLGIETSGDLTGVALVRDGKLAAEMACDHRLGHSELLVDLIRKLLEQFSLHPGDLARIGLSQGPGSFTGLRVGLAAGRALAWAAGVAGVGVPSHQALAWPSRELDQPLVLLTGLRRGLVYLEAGRWAGGEWQAQISARCVPLAELPDLLAPLSPGGRLHFLGESVESVFEAAPDLATLGRAAGGALARARRPAPVAFLAALEKAKELRGEELAGLEPLYLRGADARRPPAAARPLA